MADCKNYNATEISKFIEFLGCWRLFSPTTAIETRDPLEYRRLLYSLIEVNRTRRDAVGQAETREAQIVLAKLK